MVKRNRLYSQERKLIRRLYESLMECRIDPERFRTDLAYRAAIERRAEALQGFRRLNQKSSVEIVP